MPDLIDSMVMKLTLDTSAFKQGEAEVAKLQKQLRDDSKQTAERMEASGKQAAMFFADAKREALGLLGTLVGAGGMAAFAAKATASLSQLGREARNLGVSVQQLNAFQNVIERNGGSAESATNSLKGFVDQVQRWRTYGDPSVFRFLNPIGANIDESPMAVFMKFMRFVEDHKTDVPMIRLIGRGLGYDEGMVNAAIQMGNAAEAARQLAAENDRIATPEMVKNAQMLQQAWVDLQHQAQKTGYEILSNLAPPITKVLEVSTELVKNNPELVKGLTAITAALIGLGAVRISASIMGLTGIAATVATIATGMGTIARFGALLGFTGPAGGEDDEFSRRKNEEYLRGHPSSSPLGGWLRRNLPWWLGGTGTTGGAPPARGTAAGDVAQRMHDFWRRQGFTEAQTAGIMAGGAAFESGFNPGAVGDNGTSYGLYQHHNERWEAMQRRYGTRYPTETQQNEFAAWEISPGGPYADVGRQLRDARTEREAAEIWTRGFERPANADAEAARRGRMAPQYRGTFDANPSNMPQPTPMPPPQAVPGPVSSNTNLQIGTVVVHTAATDAKGIARDFRGAIDDAFIQQANRGLS